ncbi:hypothetical protein HG534_13135 [Moraxella osloensis]|nr:hypothetical protein [Moraxella osloensis]
MTPNERHTLKDGDILARRESVLVMAKQANPYNTPRKLDQKIVANKIE